MKSVVSSNKNKCLFLKGGSADDQIKWRCEITQMFIGGIEDFPTFRDNMMEQTGYYITKTDYNKLVKTLPSSLIAIIKNYTVKPYFDGNNLEDEKKMFKL